MYIVTFKMIVFRPFIGETLIGKVSNSSEKGIKGIKLLLLLLLLLILQ